MAAIHDTDLMGGTPPGLVRRVLSGESIGRLSDETGIPVSELRGWVRLFIEAGTKALHRHAHGSWKNRQPLLSKDLAAPRQDSWHGEQDDADAPHLTVEEHLHQLWITLGLGDED